MNIETIETSRLGKAAQVCQVTFRRGRNTPLTLTLKGTPDLEDYFRTLSRGQVTEAQLMGRGWTPTDGGNLMIYNLPPGIHAGVVGTTEKGSYRIDAIGQPLMAQDPEVGRLGGEVLQLGWLRAAGISEGQGVSFSVKGVYSLEYIKKIQEAFTASMKHFFVNYMKPVDIVVTMSTMEQ